MAKIPAVTNTAATPLALAQGAQPPETIRVFVRKGVDDNERRLSFNRPSNIPSRFFLWRGLALDGNQAVCTISGHYDDDMKRWTYTYPDLGFDTQVASAVGGSPLDFIEWKSADTLTEALLILEIRLSELLNSCDYAVEFV